MVFLAMMGSRRAASRALLLSACVWTACSAPALPPGYRKAEKLERAGRYEEALKEYADAARTCKKRPDACATTGMRVAQMHLKLGRTRQAVAAYLKVARGSGRGIREGARALARAAKLQSSLGDWAGALRLWWEVIDTYPEALAADDALGRIVQRHKDEKRLWHLVPVLRARYLKLKHHDIGDNLLWEAAQILETSREVAKQDLAVRLYEQILQFKQGGLRDNAWMAAAAIRRRQGRFRDAIALYQALLRTREDSAGGASYHSEFLDDATLAIGQIWLLDLRKPGRAISAFEDLISGKPTSVLRDDAQFWIVLAEVERGRDSAARKAYRKLREQYPESRFLRENRALSRWLQLRAAAKRGDVAGACTHWAALRKTDAFSWLVRKGPRPAPWPKCAEPEVAR